jgi:Protein of unknown function (DUF3987)
MTMSLAQNIEFDSLMEPVALKLLGEPGQKNGTDWRYGTRGSLSVNIAKGQWFDHEANEGGGVIDLIKRQGHPQPATWLRSEGLLGAPQVVPQAKPKIARTYDYRDERGELLYQVVRLEPKDFRQRRPDGRGGWDWKLGDVRRVLYRLPELIKAVADSETIYIPEGEKDVDNLRAIGLAATTNAGGVKKWRPEYCEHFRGADVVVVPDNDEAGREHSDLVAESLRGIAKRIRILDIGKMWPECPPKGDISDWLRAGGTTEKLKAMVEALPSGPAATHNQHPEPASVEQNSQFAEPAWPVMHDAAYHGLAGEVVHTISPHSEADPVAILLQFLAAFGNAVGPAPYYQVEGDRHRAKLFVVTSGATSKGRKGTSLGRVRQLMAIAEQSWERDNIQSGLSSGEGVIFHVRDPISKLGKDGVIEEVDSGATDKRLMLVTEEFAGALRVMERAGNTLSPVLRDAWGTSRLQTLTKNSPLKATDSHISIIGHVTDDELRAVLTKVEMANGFANRFLFSRVRRSKLLAHGGHLDFQTLQDLGERIAVKLKQAQSLGRVTMTDAAAEAWEQNYGLLSGDRPGLLGSILGRAEAQVIRLALIYALLDNETQIDLPHLGAALAIWAFCEDSATQIWGDMIGDDIADTILTALRGAGSAGMPRTGMWSLFSRHAPAARITMALDTLSRAGKVERMPGGGHGEQRWRYKGAPQ